MLAMPYISTSAGATNINPAAPALIAPVALLEFACSNPGGLSPKAASDAIHIS